VTTLLATRHKSSHRIPWSRLLRLLEEFYRQGNWRVPVLRARGADPFLVLVSTILSQRTRDEVTERATIRLLSVFPTPTLLSRASPARIRSLIGEVGLSDVKSKALKECAKSLVNRFGGVVPSTEADLRTLPMVGPKTAHAVLVFGHEKEGLPIDSHILRVTRRLGVVRGTTIPEAQRELALAVPRRYWKLLNPVLVQHGQNLCRYSTPECGVCPIAPICPYPGKS